MKLFVDTWGWIAIAFPRDSAHLGSLESYEKAQTSGGIFTSDYVLDETVTILFARLPYLTAWTFCSAILNSASIRIEAIDRNRFLRAFELRRKFADKPRISFTDFTSMVLMAELKISEVLTADAHFSEVGMGFRRLPPEQS